MINIPVMNFIPGYFIYTFLIISPYFAIANPCIIVQLYSTIKIIFMKHLSVLFAVIIFFTACKKISNNELLQNNISAANAATLTPQPIPASLWYSLPVPSVSPGTPNSPDGYNFVVSLSSGYYCTIGGFANCFKLNTSTKRWETFVIPNHDHPFAGLAVGEQYLFSYQDKFYTGLGYDDDTVFNSMVARDVQGSPQISKTKFPGIAVKYPTCFVINDKGYLMGGTDRLGKIINQLWQYDFVLDNWTNKGNSPLGARAEATAMVVASRVYMGLGYENITLNGQKIKIYKTDWLLYDAASSLSATRASFPAAARSFANGFVINAMPYLGFGNNGNTYFKDFWKYNTTTNTWTQQANWPGSDITTWYQNLSIFSFGNNGYVVKGDLAEFWQFTDF